MTASVLSNLAKSFLGGSNVDEDNIDDWINCDTNKPGFEYLIDEEITVERKRCGFS